MELPRDAGALWRPKRGVSWEARMRGFPHSNDPEETMKGELWAGVTPSEWSPVTWIPVKRGPEGSEAKSRELNIKPNETRTPCL
ncbi:MAG: hypothetical protein ACPLQS_03030 [Desulfurococcaceae archaeon]